MWIEFELGRAAGRARGSSTRRWRCRSTTRGAYRRAASTAPEILTELGRHEESETDLEEVLRIAPQLGDPGSRVAYVHWERMSSASHARRRRRDRRTTSSETEAHRADWWEHGRFDFLAEAADCLARVGQTALASEYLERVRADPGDAERLIAMAECALLARARRPDASRRAALHRAPRTAIAPREQWRVTLLGATPPTAAGDADAPACWRRERSRRRRGWASRRLPLIRERELTEALLALAARPGSRRRARSSPPRCRRR